MKCEQYSLVDERFDELVKHIQYVKKIEQTISGDFNESTCDSRINLLNGILKKAQEIDSEYREVYDVADA